MRFTGKNYFVRFAEGFKLDYFHLREPCDYIMGIFVVFFQKLCNLIDAQLLLSILNKQLYDFCLFAFHVNITIILCTYIKIYVFSLEVYGVIVPLHHCVTVTLFLPVKRSFIRLFLMFSSFDFLD